MNTSTAMRRTVGGAVAVLVLALAPATAAYAATAASVTSPGPVTTYTSYPVGVSAASDDTQTISSLELFADGVPVGTHPCDPVDVTCAGDITWLPTSVGDGSVDLTVTAYDGATALSTSDPVAVAVSAAPAPTASITTASTEVGAPTFAVAFTSATDSSQVDRPELVELYVNDGTTNVKVDQFDCPLPLATTCADSFTWSVPLDRAGASYTLSVRVLTDLGRATTSSGVVFSTPVPTVLITAPADGATSTSATPTVTATAGTAAFLDDTPASIQLKVDGTPVGAAVACPVVADQHSCEVTLPWTAVSGGYALTAEVTTTGGATATSDPASDITVDLPPTVSITAPAAGQVTGVVTISATASVDAGASDRVTSLQLLVGGSPSGDPVACTPTSPGARTCTGDLTFDTTGKDGPFTFSVVASTDSSTPDTATSDGVTVTVSTPLPTVSIDEAFADPAKGLIAVDVAAATTAGTSDFPDYVELFDGAALVGTLECVDTEHTCSGTIDWDTTLLDGPHSLTAKVTTVGSNGNGPVEVTSSATDVSVLTPAPTAAITTSFANPTVGTVVVDVEAATDSSTTFFPASIALVVDGTPVGTAVTCSGTSHSCSGTVTWDATGLTGSASVKAVVTTTAAGNGEAAVTADSATSTVTVATPAPTVSVAVTPISGSTIKGAVTITVTATSDARLTARAPTQISLGSGLGGTLTPSGLTQACAAASVCTKSWTWDTTALTGAKTVTASALFQNVVAAVTATKAVTVANPLPTVSFVSPSSGTVITRTTTIKVTAGTDASTSDFPKTVQLLVNGSVKASSTCTTSVHTCTKSFSWSPGTLDGPQSFSARVTTTKGAVRTTSARTYYAYYKTTSSSTSVSALTTVVSGTRVTVRGKVISTKTNAGVAGISVRITRDPAIGSTASTTVVTSSSGSFSFSFTARTNTAVTARALSKTFNGSTWFTGSSRTVRQLVRGPITCTILDASLSKGQTGQGSCTVQDLPVGTPLTLTYTIGGRTTTLASGRSKSETISFSFVFPAKGTYTLRVTLSSNAVYTSTSSPGITVTQA